MFTTETLPPAQDAPRLAFPRALIGKLRIALPKASRRRPRPVAGLNERLLADLGLRPVQAPGDSRQYAAARRGRPADRPSEFDYAYYAALQRR